MLVYNTTLNKVSDIPEGDTRGLQTFLNDSNAYWDGSKAMNGAGGITSPSDYYEQLHKLLNNTKEWHRRSSLAEGIKRVSVAMVEYEKELEDSED